jgi:hypothetical protein
MSNYYDMVIVGAGAAGLRVGIHVMKQYPTIRCCLLEKYNYVGGRIVTFRNKLPSVGHVQWENGAGRISTSHRRVLALIQQYGLHTVPLSKDIAFLSVHQPELRPNSFYRLHSMYFTLLKQLAPSVLATHTLYELLVQMIGVTSTRHLVISFPYYSEIYVLRADLALAAFDAEMNSNHGFVVCTEGFQSITNAMFHEFQKRGGVFIPDMEVTSIHSLDDHSIQLIAKKSNCLQPIVGKTVVLALHSTALRSIQGISLPVLRHLEMPPLLRIYAIYPKQHGKVWFDGLPNIVTDSTLRYLIPYHVKKGIIMISYTEGPDAEFWKKMSLKQVKPRIASELARLFPKLTIPPPLFIKMHPWTNGCSYWKPGHYDPAQESRQSLHPLRTHIPSLFVCSESFSIRQSWMESALEQADALLSLPSFQEHIQYQYKNLK